MLEVPLKVSVAPKIAVTTDAVLVEQEPSREMRRRLEERKPVPDELESKDAEGGAALGDPTSMRSWLSCLDIVEESSGTKRRARECGSGSAVILLDVFRTVSYIFFEQVGRSDGTVFTSVFNFETCRH